jgi:hypothetical protein
MNLCWWYYFNCIDEFVLMIQLFYVDEVMLMMQLLCVDELVLIKLLSLCRWTCAVDATALIVAAAITAALGCITFATSDPSYYQCHWSCHCLNHSYIFSVPVTVLWALLSSGSLVMLFSLIITKFYFVLNKVAVWCHTVSSKQSTQT